VAHKWDFYYTAVVDTAASLGSAYHKTAALVIKEQTGERFTIYSWMLFKLPYKKNWDAV
jgi:hypothetical protein